MHALLAHAYHLAQHGIGVFLHPGLLAPAGALVVALLGRAAGAGSSPRVAALTAGAAMLAGWLLLDTHWTAFPPPPVARLPGLALILLAEAFWRTRGTVAPARKGAKRVPPVVPTRRGWLVLTVTAELAGWWLRGAPLDGPGILNCMPVLLGLVAGLAMARRRAQGDRGWGSAAAAAALGGGLLVTGAAVHWAVACLVPLAAALALLGVDAAAGVLAGGIVMVAGAAIVASDRGRLIPIDVACVLPLLAWVLTRRMA